MLTAIEGVYRDGKVELLGPAPNVRDAKVIVTFLAPENPVDLQDRGIDRALASDLRYKLKAIANDWNQPEMDAYDAL